MCTYIYKYHQIYIYTHLFYIYIYMYVYVCICMYNLKCVFTLYIYIYIQLYLHTFVDVICTYALTHRAISWLVRGWCFLLGRYSVYILWSENWAEEVRHGETTRVFQDKYHCQSCTWMWSNSPTEFHGTSEQTQAASCGGAMKRGHEDVGHSAGGDGPTMDPLLVMPQL